MVSMFFSSLTPPPGVQDTLRECRPQERHCLTYLPLISPIYFVTFVLTAQFVLVNVVVAVLMKHLEESNKEAKEEAELAEAELELERQVQGGDTATRSPQINPLTRGMDNLSSGSSPLRSTGGGDRDQERECPIGPPADITRDSVNIRADPPSSLEPPLEVRSLHVCTEQTSSFPYSHYPCERALMATRLIRL